MKSPLVDALRQANENARSKDDTDTLLVDDLEHDALLTANEDYPAEEPLKELELLEATGVLQVDTSEREVAPSDNEPANELHVEEEAAVTQHEDAPVDEEPEIHLSASRELTATQALRQTSLAVDAPPLPLLKDHAMTPVMKAGRASPLICVALAGVAAALYLAYAALGGAYENADLRALSSQVGAESDGLAQFEESSNPFRLILNETVADAQEGSDAQ